MLKGNSSINNSGNNQVEEHQYRNIPVVGKTLARGLPQLRLGVLEELGLRRQQWSHSPSGTPGWSLVSGQTGTQMHRVWLHICAHGSGSVCLFALISVSASAGQKL